VDILSGSRSGFDRELLSYVLAYLKGMGEMEAQIVFNALIGLAAFFGGWVLNNITKAIERLDNDVREMPKQYVSREDFHRDIDEIKDICKQIFAKLDHKADK
jgi:hypothetical protein